MKKADARMACGDCSYRLCRLGPMARANEAEQAEGQADKENPALINRKKAVKWMDDFYRRWAAAGYEHWSFPPSIGTANSRGKYYAYLNKGVEHGYINSFKASISR